MTDPITKPESTVEKTSGAVEKFIAPSGAEIEVKTFFTARERNKLKRTTLSGMTVKPDPNNPKQAQTSDINAEIQIDMEEKILELGVVSYKAAQPENTQAESPVITDNKQLADILLDGNPADYDAVIQKLSPLLESLFQTAK
jgi:hypothetical protein